MCVGGLYYADEHLHLLEKAQLGKSLPSQSQVQRLLEEVRR